MTLLFRYGISGALVLLTAAAFDSQAQATTTVDRDVICNPHIPPQTRANFLKDHPEFVAVKCETGAAKPAAAQSKPSRPSQATNSVNSKSASTTPQIPLNAEFPVTKYFIRNDWTDLGLLGAGCTGNLNAPSVDQAKGASVSFTRDYAGNNKIWAAQGMAAAVFSDCLNIPPSVGSSNSGLVEKSIAVYAQINSDYNSSAALAKKNNLDTRTAGLSGELAYLTGGDYNVVRVTPNVVFDNIKGTTAFAIAAQYIPVWISQPGIWRHYNLFGDFWFQFDPTFDVQYANAMGHSSPLQFSGKDQSLRLGPELTFLVTPLNIAGSYLQNIGISETFHPWYDTYANRGSYWWANSIYYNFTSNFAVSFSYDRGLDENSGTMTNQYVASLTGKY
jgi:hypothetical protein